MKLRNRSSFSNACWRSRGTVPRFSTERNFWSITGKSAPAGRCFPPSFFVPRHCFPKGTFAKVPSGLLQNLCREARHPICAAAQNVLLRSRWSLGYATFLLSFTILRLYRLFTSKCKKNRVTGRGKLRISLKPRLHVPKSVQYRRMIAPAKPAPKLFKRRSAPRSGKIYRHIPR